MMNDNDSGYLAGILANHANEEHSQKMDLLGFAYKLKPRLSIDGNQWCALYGENLQSGVAGFGDSPYLAYRDFDREWLKTIKIKSRSK